MAKQMEMFDDGGLMDEGGTVDPVSGNDVPPGSTQEEVRDDIPAQLSEGEFVFPADVVRYFGLEKLMEMRQEAKMGLQRMEDMGQMGNSEEAIMPDNLPFSIEDLDTEDEGEYNTPQEFAYGGVVQMPGTNYTTTPNPGPTTGFRPYVAPTIPGSPQPVQTDPQYQGVQLPGTQFIGATQKTNIPTFGQTVGTNSGQYDEFRTYVNSSGQTLRIPFKNGQPLYPIPQGYTLQKEDAVKTESTVPTTTVGQDGDDTSGDGDSEGLSTISSGSLSTLGKTSSVSDKSSNEFVEDILSSNAATEAYHENAFGGNATFGTSNPSMKAATIAQGLYQMESMSATSALGIQMGNMLGISESALPNDIATAGEFGKQAALAAMAMSDVTQLSTSAQATMYGNVITAAHEAAKKGENINAAIQAEISNHPQATKLGLSTAVAQYGNLKGIGIKSISDIDKPGVMAQVAEIAKSVARTRQSQADQIGKAGAVKDSKGNAVKDSKGKNVMTASALARQKALEKEAKAANAAAAAAAQAAAAQEIAANKALADAGGYNPTDDIGVGSSGGSSVSGQEGIGGEGFGGFGDDGEGNPTGAPICLTEDMKVKRNGIIDFVTKVQIGDIIDNTVVTEVLHKHMREGYYVVNGELKITNDHPVLANGSWKRTEDLVLGDYINNVEVTSLEYVEQVTPTVYIGTADDRYDVYTEGEVYTVHGQYKNALEKVA